MMTLVTAASDGYMPLHRITSRSKVSYCEKWEIAYWFRKHRLATAWERVDIWLEAIKRGGWIFFMGADTLVANPEIDPYSFADEMYDLIIAKDINCINSDVFMLRASGLAIEWMQHVRGLEGKFANEQDAMIACLNDENFRVKIVTNRTFNSYWHRSHPYLHYSREYVDQSVFQDGDFCLHLTNLPMEQRIEVAKIYGGTYE
jgi:hypothetical protein